MKTFWIFLFAAGFTLPAYAQEPGQYRPAQTHSLSKARLNLNTISTVFFNDGLSDIDDQMSDAGFHFPRGSSKTAVYMSGLLWGGMKPGDSLPHVGGSSYRSGLWPGKIASTGIAESPNLPKNRIYRVRKDVFPGGPDVDLSIEATDEGLAPLVIRSKYETDRLQWPAQDGAPYQDINGNGTYEALLDIPGVKGAAQTIWYVANDLDSGKTNYLYGATPLGIELQVTLWNYTETEQLSSMYFKKYVLINKSGGAINEMYISQWCDPDIGNSSDDFVGCDTIRNLGFAYNAAQNDTAYGSIAPAAGFDLLQGPIVAGIAGQDRNKNGIDDELDYAVFNGKEKGPGYINLPMTAFYYFFHGDPTFLDPLPRSIEGSIQFYNYFQGKAGLSGNYFVDPVSNQPTSFAVSGDPVLLTGWLDGIAAPLRDRRMGLSSGPFTFAPGDTQEVILAEIAAGGESTRNALKIWRYYDVYAQRLYDSRFAVPVVPAAPSPEVTWKNSSSGITLSWESTAEEVESFNQHGYSFEGYNVYQLYSEIPSIYNAVKIAAFDKVNDVTQITGETMNPLIGYPAQGVVQSGTNSGLRRQISIVFDYLGNCPLKRGSTCYYAVTAYAYNPSGSPKSTETLIKVNKIVVPERAIPVSSALLQNYPNPFNSGTVIKYAVKENDRTEPVLLKVYSILGSEVATLVNEQQSAGEYRVNFSGDGLPSGVYVYSIRIGSFTQNRKMLLLR